MANRTASLSCECVISYIVLLRAARRAIAAAGWWPFSCPRLELSRKAAVLAGLPFLLRPIFSHPPNPQSLPAQSWSPLYNV